MIVPSADCTFFIEISLLLIVHQNHWFAATPLASHVMGRTRRWRERARHGRGSMTRTFPAISRENLCWRTGACLISPRGTRDGWLPVSQAFGCVPGESALNPGDRKGERPHPAEPGQCSD